MMKQILCDVLTVPIYAAVPQMASAPSLNRSDFHLLNETKQAKEYKLNVEGLGTVANRLCYRCFLAGLAACEKNSFRPDGTSMPPGPHCWSNFGSYEGAHNARRFTWLLEPIGLPIHHWTAPAPDPAKGTG